MKTKVHIKGNGKWGHILKKTIEKLEEYVKPNEADLIII